MPRPFGKPPKGPKPGRGPRPFAPPGLAGRRIPPGLAKKPGQMPPGQYRKLNPGGPPPVPGAKPPVPGAPVNKPAVGAPGFVRHDQTGAVVQPGSRNKFGQKRAEFKGLGRKFLNRRKNKGKAYGRGGRFGRHKAGQRPGSPGKPN